MGNYYIIFRREGFFLRREKNWLRQKKVLRGTRVFGMVKLPFHRVGPIWECHRRFVKDGATRFGSRAVLDQSVESCWRNAGRGGGTFWQGAGGWLWGLRTKVRTVVETGQRRKARWQWGQGLQQSRDLAGGQKAKFQPRAAEPPIPNCHTTGGSRGVPKGGGGGWGGNFFGGAAALLSHPVGLPDFEFQV